MQLAAIRVRIRELRGLKGWSQAELARQSGVRQASVNRIESGESTGVSLGIVQQLAKALGCDPGYLIVKKEK